MPLPCREIVQYVSFLFFKSECTRECTRTMAKEISHVPALPCKRHIKCLNISRKIFVTYDYDYN